MKVGSCLCGAFSFRISGDLKRPDSCHCTQCRKFSGHYFVSTDVPSDSLSINGSEHVTWYYSSERVRRGFCAICGSSLFFDPRATHWIGVAMGAFDSTTETSAELHVYAGEKGDYYEIGDGLPQYERLPTTLR